MPGISALVIEADDAKNAGVPSEGSGSHRLTVVGDLGRLTDPDGFKWEAP
jgi:hypothetical protein